MKVGGEVKGNECCNVENGKLCFLLGLGEECSLYDFLCVVVRVSQWKFFNLCFTATFSLNLSNISVLCG